VKLSKGPIQLVLSVVGHEAALARGCWQSEAPACAQATKQKSAIGAAHHQIGFFFSWPIKATNIHATNFWQISWFLRIAFSSFAQAWKLNPKQQLQVDLNQFESIKAIQT